MTSSPAMNEQSQRVDLVGRVLMNKLRVVRLLGEGGMGAVYEVEHLITRHHRALKVMHSKLSTNAETIARFIREAGVAGTLRTPYVVETFDAGQLDDGSPYVLMELLEGQPLSAVFDSPAPLPVGRLVGLVCQMLEGLAVAHRAGIVHRDVKPDNVFVGMDERGLERVRILDFGISKFTQGQPDYQGTLTSEGAMMGTPYYMSPEQALGIKDIDARSDLYSVGVMLYEGLARRRPYEGQTLAALVLKIHHGDHPRLGDVVPGLPRALADAVERALSVEPAKRFSTAEEMLAVLVPHSDSKFVTSLQTLRNAAPQFAETLDAMPGPKAAAARTRAPSSRTSPAALIAAGVVVLLVLGGVGVWALSDLGEGPAPSPPEAAVVEEPVRQPAVTAVPTGVLPPPSTSTPEPPPESPPTLATAEPGTQGADAPATPRRPRDGATMASSTAMVGASPDILTTPMVVVETPMVIVPPPAEGMTAMAQERYPIDRDIFE